MNDGNGLYVVVYKCQNNFTLYTSIHPRNIYLLHLVFYLPKNIFPFSCFFYVKDSLYIWKYNHTFVVLFDYIKMLLIFNTIFKIVINGAHKAWISFCIEIERTKFILYLGYCCWHKYFWFCLMICLTQAQIFTFFVLFVMFCI